MQSKNKKMAVAISSLLTFSVFVSCPVGHKAVSLNIEQKKKDRSKLQTESEKLRKDLIKTQKDIDEENRNKEELDNKISDLKEKIDSLNNYINELRNQILEIEKHIDEIQKDIDKKVTLLREALVMMYKAGDASLVDIVLESTDVNDFFEKFDIVKSVGNKVSEVIDSLKAKMQEMEEEKAKIDSIKKQQEEENDKLERSRSELQDLLIKSEETLSAYKETEENTKSQISQNESAIAVADAEIKKYYEEQKKKERERLNSKRNANKGKPAMPVVDSNSQVVNQGGLMWPVPGFKYISSGFYDTAGRSKMHGAIDIAGSGIYGANVVASGSGTVISVIHSNSGYGNNIVVDHGGGLSTRYSHLSAIAVSNGQKVSKGQVIGQVGSTGFSTGPHLDFTVMQNGNKQNPLNYVSNH